MQAPLNGLILAGGHSLRMGHDKGAIAYHGTNHAHYLANLLAEYVQDIFVSVRKEQQSAPHLQGLQTITDRYDSPSALNGIVSAMHSTPNASWLVVAVDMPFIDKTAIEMLIANRDPQSIATCFASPVKGGPDPLFAIWEHHGFAALEALVSNTTEHVCPRNVLKKMSTHIITQPLAAHTLSNINTPEELAALRQ